MQWKEVMNTRQELEMDGHQGVSPAMLGSCDQRSDLHNSKSKPEARPPKQQQSEPDVADTVTMPPPRRKTRNAPDHSLHDTNTTSFAADAKYSANFDIDDSKCTGENSDFLKEVPTNC
jgi:hypothetical protein